MLEDLIPRKLRDKYFLVVSVLTFLSGFALNWFISSRFPPYALFKQPEKSIFQDKRIPGETQKSGNAIFKACQTTGDRENCYAREFGALTKETSFEHAVSTLTALQTVDEEARGCHFIAHNISTAATEKDPDQWQLLLGKLSPDACSGGYLHGVLEARYKIDDAFVLDAKTVPQICALTIRNNKDARDGNCAHIMGHLLLVETGAHIDEAVNMCAALPKKMQFECHSGVFMENETRENLIAHKLAKKLPWDEETIAKQVDICMQYTGPAHVGCWRELSHMIAFVYKDDPGTLYLRCQDGKSQESIDECYEHGLSIISHTSHFRNETSALFCQPYIVDDEKYWGCVNRVIGSLIKSTPEFSTRAIGYCKTMPTSDLSSCYESVGKHLAKYLPKDGRARYCANVPGDYKELCVGG
ncbi:MAG: hypothetical protein HY431_01270 [Candidatus Levybacteria bacterium]|nr:hypothetical protein [Candidatus Levybacteria bacterium]